MDWNKAKKRGKKNMPKFNVGDCVHVPASKYPELSDYRYAFYKAKVESVNDRTITFCRDRETLICPISKVHSNLGILIVSIGDFDSESTLIDPLSKSILHFVRLLLDDDSLKFLKIRTVDELRSFWENNHSSFSHIILIGHGNPDGISFIDNRILNAKDLAKLLEKPCNNNTEQKIIISLCCKTGSFTFSKELSKSSVCGWLLASKDNIHGANASQFCQTFLTNHLLNGQTSKVAFKKSRGQVLGSAGMRLYKNGSLMDGPKK